MIFRFYSFLIFFALALSSVSVKSQQWYLSPVFHGRNIYSVYPHSRTNIVSSGGNEQNDSLQDIFKSYSGGMTWDFANNGGGGYIRSVDFVDSINGIALGYAGKILKSADGGGSYTRIYPPGAMTQRNFTTVLYTSPQTVFGFGGRNYPNDTIQTIIKSTDGGNTWNPIRDVSGRWLKGAFFINNNTGFAVGSAGTIIKTTDGGSNWTNVSSPINTRDFNAVYFSSPSTGYIVGGSFVMFDTLTSMRTILKTTDGGDNWNVIMDEPGGWLTAIDFVDVNTGYISGDAAQLYKTTNAGNNWLRQTVQGTQWYSNLTSVKFLNQNFGVVGGMYGEVYFYSNEPLPEVITMPATVTAVTDTNATATMRANVNTNGSPVIYNFKYSTTPDFSANVGFALPPIWPVTFNSNSLSAIEASLNTLLPNTTYYYFPVITSINATVYGDTLSFTTTIPYSVLQTNTPSSNNFFTVFNGTINGASESLNLFFEYGTTPLFGNEVQANPSTVNNNQSYVALDTIFSLQPNTVYYCRLKAVSQTDIYYANTVSFFAGTLFSDFEATEASNITLTSATLNAVVNNYRLPLTNIIFEYGTNQGQLSDWVTAVPSTIADTLEHVVSVDISNLQSNTFYYFRLHGQNTLGNQNSNTAYFFTGVTHQSIITQQANSIGETYANLNGSIEDLPYASSINFEYGNSPLLGSSISASPNFINDTLSHDFTAFVNNLLPGTQYWFRLVATHTNGSFYGNVESFFTSFTSDYFAALPATNVTSSSAQLNGKISHFNVPLSLSFEFGLTDTLGTEISANPESINDSLYHSFSAGISNLLPDTFYYFRLKASTGNQFLYTPIRKIFTAEPEILNWDFQQCQPDTILLPNQWNIADPDNFEQATGHSGNYALKITKTNFAILGFPADGDNNDGPQFYGGCPFTSRPDSVSFFLDYFLNPLDSGLFLIYAYSGDSVIAADFNFIAGNSNSNFQRFSFPLNYISSLTPDSVVLGFVAFNPFSQSQILVDHSDNYFSIDDIEFSPTASHNCHTDFENWFEYPYDNFESWYYLKSVLVDPLDIEGSHTVVKVQSFSPEDIAVQIKNIPRIGKWFSAELSNTKGKDFAGGNLRGTPVSRRYQHLNGYCKYSLVEQDTAVIEVVMYKNSEYIGMGRQLLSGINNNFEQIDLLISYENDTIVPDSVIISFRANNQGEAMGYASLAIDKLSFDGFWGILPDTTSGIHDQFSEDQFKIYPNPAKNNFIVELSESHTGQTFTQIMDIDGRLINQLNFPPGQTRFVFDVSNFNAGLYFIKVSTRHAVFNKKIVVLK